MSQENVEVVLRAVRLFETDGISEMRSDWHADARMTAPAGWPEPGPFEGVDAIIEQFQRLASDLRQNHIRDVTVIADGRDWVVFSFVWEVRGAGSGAAIASKMAGSIRFVDARIKEAHYRWNPGDALEAAGLSE